MTNMFWDKQGNPIGETPDKWIPLSQDLNYRRVAETQVGTYWVSTVWIGIDLGFGSQPPLLFESMVFANSSAKGIEGNDVYMNRYATEAEAIEGHKTIVERLTAGTLDIYEDNKCDVCEAKDGEPHCDCGKCDCGDASDE